MKNYHWMLIAVASLGLFATSGVANNHVINGSMGVLLPGVQSNGNLYCFGGGGVANYKFNTSTYRGVVRTRGNVNNDSGRTQRYRTNALLDSCVGEIIFDTLHEFGLHEEDLEGVSFRASYKVRKNGKAKGVAAVRLPAGIFENGSTS